MMRSTAETTGVGRARFEADQMGMCQPQFGGVFDGDDALAVGNEVGQDVKQRGLARAGAAGNDDVLAVQSGRAHKFGHLRADCGKADQAVGSQGAAREFTDGERRALERQRRDDGIDPRAVLQARIDHGGGFVDAR